MGKGFFTQGAAVLLSRAASLDEIESLLHSFRIVSRDDAGAADPDLSGPSFVVAFRPEVNGYVAIDVQNRPWPDHMGDAKQEVGLFGAWSMGHFGTFTFPGSLERAGQQCWSWDAGKAVPGQHRAFIRIKMSYLFGASGDALAMPADCDPVAELEFVTAICRALLDHPAALAYFNPSGEVLCGSAMMDEVVEGCARLQVPPTNLWCNVRLFNANPQWMLMDTVGASQLDRDDIEACFLRDRYEPGDVDGFLRTVSQYVLENGAVIQDGDTMDGPGNVPWRARHVEDSLVAPPRPVLRWFPVDFAKVPPELG